MCFLREDLLGGRRCEATLAPLAQNIPYRKSETELTLALPYNAHTNCSRSAKVLSSTSRLRPSAENVSIKVSLFLMIRKAGNFPFPAKELIVSHPVNAYSPTIASHTRLVRPDAM